MEIRTILVPTDYSRCAKKALATAIEFARVFNARIVLLHSFHAEIPMVSAMEGPYSLPPGFYGGLESAAKEHIEELAARLTEKEGVEVLGRVASEPAAFAIVGHAEELPADLIVMGTRGLTGLKHVMLGSVAERIVRTAGCPVLTVNDAD